MKSLTKENFWNALYEKYSEVAVFCGWIDEYKRSVEWDNLFNNGSMKHYARQSIKFHDLPIAMQWGIFCQFASEMHPSGFGGIVAEFEHPSDMDKIPELITEYFAQMKSRNDHERMSLKYDNDNINDNSPFE